MYKLDHAPDFLEFQAIQRRRRLDQERMQRVFDPKVRIIGIDVQGLEEQIRIKQEIREIEAQSDFTHDIVASETNKLLQLLDTKVDLVRREINHEVNKFRSDHQKTSERRDFDLYDPASLKKDSPARTSDDDARNTVSGAQKFEGEDLEKADRTRMQRQQVELWTWQKMREDEAKLTAQAQYDALREREVISNNTKILNLIDLERNNKHAAAKSDMEFNRRMAMEKRLREKSDKFSEVQKNQKEIESMVNGDFLTERPATAQPGPHGIRVDSYRGMSQAEINEIRATREKQVVEARMIAENAKKNDAAWAKQNFWASRATLLMERESQRLEKERQGCLLESNARLATEFKARKNHFNKVVYTNPPTDAYYHQFNTTSR